MTQCLAFGEASGIAVLSSALDCVRNVEGLFWLILARRFPLIRILHQLSFTFVAATVNLWLVRHTTPAL